MKFYKFLATTLVIGTISILNLSLVFAGPTGGQLVPGERIPTDTESIQRINNSDLTPTEKKRALEKYNFKDTRESFYNTFLGMKQYKQLYNYYCGPGTAYQTLKYLTGSSPSQLDLGDAMGTTEDGTIGNLLTTVVNNNQDKNTYTAHVVDQPSDLKHCINYDMLNEFPTMLRIKFNTNSEFGYSSNGHYLNIGGQNTGATKYLIVDPYYGYDGGPSDPTYYVSDTAVYKATMGHPATTLYY